jgi:hypothetical protein
MKRTFVTVIASLVAAVLFVILVHGVLVAAHRSDPAATTVHGVTVRRVWATTAVALGVASIIAGSMALVRATRGIGNRGRNGAMTGMAAGILAAVNGGLNLAIASGGPGSGNGVVGGAIALVLGTIGIGLCGMALIRGSHVVPESGQMM